MRALRIITPATAEPVTLADAKAHMRVIDDDEDVLIESLITAARQYVEAYTSRALATQTYELVLDGFPLAQPPAWSLPADVAYYGTDGPIILPITPVQSVVHIKYDDTAGVEQTMTAADYQAVLDGAQPVIWSAPDKHWPQTQAGKLGSVRVRFVAGYTTVPHGLRAAIKMLAAHWYMHREPTAAPNSTAPVPLSIESLIQQYRVTP